MSGERKYESDHTASPVIAEKDRRIAELEAALRPFAKHSVFFRSHDAEEHFECHPKDSDGGYVANELTVANLRRAAKALKHK